VTDEVLADLRAAAEVLGCDLFIVPAGEEQEAS
jgi:hypothetical protein